MTNKPTSDEWDDNAHLKLGCVCSTCSWEGVNGELIAKDKLRCPNCNSSAIHYSTNLKDDVTP